MFVYKQIATQEGIPSYARDKAEEIVSIHRNAFESYFNRNIVIGAGSDAGSPCTSHRALLDELYTMNEMIPDAKEVLKTATVNAGKILGHDVGQIKEGYRANLILLKENPLECLSNLESIKMVVIRGKVLMKYTNNNLEMIAE
ncbi:amidohydrolase family protein [Cytobacillus pseudoceanisediminis]|uniref:amidohydrolase family protein n=1 Tax=Cytobacillus pseudoceanisediminis TaxID=3051614 RepID=UPI0025418729|nr:amidohydrolase family protein [Cytobacillus pseudoceanisediminis]